MGGCHQDRFLPLNGPVRGQEESRRRRMPIFDASPFRATKAGWKRVCLHSCIATSEMMKRP
jgi:hypothetical protein